MAGSRSGMSGEARNIYGMTKSEVKEMKRKAHKEAKREARKEAKGGRSVDTLYESGSVAGKMKEAQRRRMPKSR